MSRCPRSRQAAQRASTQPATHSRTSPFPRRHHQTTTFATPSPTQESEYRTHLTARHTFRGFALSSTECNGASASESTRPRMTHHYRGADHHHSGSDSTHTHTCTPTRHVFISHVCIFFTTNSNHLNYLIYCIVYLYDFHINTNCSF